MYTSPLIKKSLFADDLRISVACGENYKIPLISYFHDQKEMVSDSFNLNKWPCITVKHTNSLEIQSTT